MQTTDRGWQRELCNDWRGAGCQAIIEGRVVSVGVVAWRAYCAGQYLPWLMSALTLATNQPGAVRPQNQTDRQTDA